MAKFGFQDVVFAFAGIQQAAFLVQQLATTGRCDEEAFNASINTLYHIDSPNVLSIYGGKQGLRLGLSLLNATLTPSKKSASNRQVTRLIIGMVHAERHLQRKPHLVNTLKRKITYTQSQADFFNAVHPVVINSLGKTYEETIGKLPFKIMIMGKKELLGNPELMGKIRAVLLAGIRSAVLWHQVGGSRWHLVFGRSRYRKVLKELGY